MSLIFVSICLSDSVVDFKDKKMDKNKETSTYFPLFHFQQGHPLNDNIPSGLCGYQALLLVEAAKSSLPPQVVTWAYQTLNIPHIS